MRTFLDQKELETLTGYKLHKKQIEFLASINIPFVVNAAGVPVVMRSALEQKAPPITQPNWSVPA